MTERTHETKTTAGSDKPATIDGVEYEYTKSRKVKRAVVTLDFDFDVDGINYSKLNFRRMKTKDTYGGETETDEIRAGLTIYASMAGVAMEVIDEIDAEDLERITEAVLPLMGKSASRIAKAEMDKMRAASE